MQGMASAFGDAGQVWAPRYRQATLGAFLAEDRVTAFGGFAHTVDVLEDPLNLAAGEVRRRRQTGLAADDVAVAFAFQRRGDAVGAGVLPHDGVVDGLARGLVPDDGGLALVGDADGVDVAGVQRRRAQRLRDDRADVVPHLDGVVLNPTGAREDLLVLLLPDGHDGARVVEDDRARARRALIDCQYVFVSHECSLPCEWGFRGGSGWIRRAGARRRGRRRGRRR